MNRRAFGMYIMSVIAGACEGALARLFLPTDPYLLKHHWQLWASIEERSAGNVVGGVS